ncbi:MAG: bifunctional 2-dehydro-3-deoxygluconokinase/2-dehydro-3-deoxygalactonokinase [Halovenus sp.]
MTSLVTFGETMLRLSPPAGQRLSRVDCFDVHVGGAESNVAAAASTFGVDAAWLSALPETDLGERIVSALRAEGVEPVVTWTETGRVGTFYFEPGGKPRGQAVVYDRTGTPVRDLTPGDLPLDRVRDADLFFTTGITPALSDRLATTTGELFSTASDAGVPTAFDLNYRSNLWSPAEARETLTALFPAIDVLFVAERDARGVLGRSGDPEPMARSLADDHGLETVVLTRGDRGALAVDDGTCHDQQAFETETVDPVGSGDALVGGYLARRLVGHSVPDALAYGVATAALKRTVEGDMARLSAEEVTALVAGDGAGLDR